MSVNFEYYKNFYYVAKSGSFSAAARELYLTQSTVTRAIQTLEEQLCCKLFIRSNHGITLTDKGKAMFDRAKPACEMLFSIERELTNDQTNKQIICVGANEINASVYILPYLQAFIEKNPDVKIHIIDIEFDEAQSMISAGMLDFAIPGALIPSSGEINVEDDICCMGLTGIPSQSDIAVVGKKYEYLSKKKLTLEELSQYPLVITRKGSFIRNYTERLFAEHGLKLEPAVEVAASNAQINMVKKGMGYCFYNRRIIEEEILSCELFPIQLQLPLAEGKIPLLRHKTRPLSISANKFLEEILTHTAHLQEQAEKTNKS